MGVVTEPVPVAGGDLSIEVVTAGSEPVLAIHGISSQRKLWNWLRAEDPGLSLIAPDLRGRGDSLDVEGPSSMARHAADMVAALEHQDLTAAHVCGMSMGAFVAVELAVARPDLVKSLILVDGGFPMPVPPGLTREALPAMFRDRLARLDRRFDSVEAYARFFVATTAPLLDPADPLLLDYLRHDLRDGKVRLDGDALIADSADIFFGPPKWQDLSTPAALLAAEWSRGADTAPAYSEQACREFAAALPAGLLTVHPLDGADHAASIMTRRGAHATADLIRSALGA